MESKHRTRTRTRTLEIQRPPSAVRNPRLFFSASDLPDLRAKFQHPDCRPLWDRVLRHCDLTLTDDPPYICTRFLRAAHLALASLLENRDDYAVKAVEMAMQTCDAAPWVKLRTDAERAGVCLATGGAVAQLGFVYDWLYDHLTEAQRERIRETVREHGFAANRFDHDMRHKATEWYNCNGMGVVNGPLLMAALLFEDEMDTTDAVALGMQQVYHSLDAWCCDGGYTEGPLYWNYYSRHILLAMEALRRLRGIDWYELPFPRNTGDYVLHHILSDITHCANTADSDGHTRLWPAVARLASRHRVPRWQWLARQMITHPWADDDGEALEYAPFFLLWYDPELPAEPPGDADRTRLFQGLQQLSWRSDWTPQARHVLWLNGPSNSHHNHLHLNSFTFTVGDQRLIRECGKYNYNNYQDYRRLTAGHNSLLADGEGQVQTLDDTHWCRRLRAGEWDSVYGVFERHREEVDSPIATGVARNAYPGRLDRFERTLAFVERRFLLVHDDVALAKSPPLRLTWLFHGDREIEVEDDGAVFHSEKLSLRLMVHCKSPLRFRVHYEHSLRHHKTREDGEPLPCLEIETDAATMSLDTFFLLVPMETGIDGCDLKPHADGMEFGVNEKSWIYEQRTRSLRRVGDPPLPRRIV